jgi:hypothetical protein
VQYIVDLTADQFRLVFLCNDIILSSTYRRLCLPRDRLPYEEVEDIRTNAIVGVILDAADEAALLANLSSQKRHFTSRELVETIDGFWPHEELRSLVSLIDADRAECHLRWADGKAARGLVRGVRLRLRFTDAAHGTAADRSRFRGGAARAAVLAARAAAFPISSPRKSNSRRIRRNVAPIVRLRRRRLGCSMLDDDTAFRNFLAAVVRACDERVTRPALCKSMFSSGDRLFAVLEGHIKR